MRIRALLTGVVASAAALASIALTPATASADPGFTPDATDVVAVGDLVTQPLGNALATAYNGQATAPADRFASYDASGSSTITPKAGCAAIPRPRNSAQAVAALRADTTGCVEIARSVTLGTFTEQETLAYLPVAFDGVSWLVGATSNAPQALSASELAAVFSCTARTWNQVGGTSTQTIRPFLPAAGSDIRDFFLRSIGVTTPGTCVNVLPENSTALSRNAIAPFSVPFYIRLGTQAPQLRSYVRLGDIEDEFGTVRPPVDVDPTTGRETFGAAFPFEFSRQVYAVAKRQADGGVGPRVNAVVGSAGFACSTAGLEVALNQGFRPLAVSDGCGQG
ncbi:MAG: substrate-binding domain-containing protein [Pseudonocardia sp.]|nr:substrate-binding domain-containing protein [Pseudonocardia sp.]